MQNYVKGIFKKTIYRGDKGYIIGLLKVLETDIDDMKSHINKLITFTGTFADLNENGKYMMYGEVLEHPKYGFQYNVKSSEQVKPEGKDGIIDFLSSGLFKGIGEKLAKTIVDTLGDKTLERIIEDKTCLYEVPRITTQKVDIIYNTLVKYEESHEVILKLTKYGFSMNDALNIYNTYKTNTIRKLENNIYSIIDEVDGVSFTKVDEIALNNNEDKYNINRIKACIIYIMKDLTFKNGDTYLTYSEIYEGVSFYLNGDIDNEIFDNALFELSSDLKIKIEDEKYYIMEDYEAEEIIAEKLIYLTNKTYTKYKDIDEKIEELEKKEKIEYSDKQKEAIKKALENNVVIITGGPGTGKTTIIKGIVDLYKLLNKYNDTQLIEKVALLAPTGRASKRMSESTNLPASTIHRFLKWNKELDEFIVNEYNPDFSNLIIVDEVSMIDNRLMSSLLKGITNNIKLVLVGDYNQLPSVGPGNVLKNLIESDVIDKVELDLLYIQGDDSYIPVLADEIKNNDIDEDSLINKSDYKFLKCTSEAILPNLVSICNEIIKKDILIKEYS